MDIGCGAWPLDGAIGIDNSHNQNAYELDKFPDNSLDFVFSSHCLEHLEKWQTALKLWISKLKYGGILFLYLPHISQELWNPGGPWVGYWHRWSPTCNIVCQFLKKNGMCIIEANTGVDRYYSFHIAAKKLGAENSK